MLDITERTPDMSTHSDIKRSLPHVTFSSLSTDSSMSSKGYLLYTHINKKNL